MSTDESLIGLLSNTVQVEDLQPGDHIYTWRGLTYAHHGIFIGGGQVIHYGKRSEVASLAASACPVDKMIAKAKKKALKTLLWSNSTPSTKCTECNSKVQSNESCVSKTCLQCFLQGGRLCRYEYGVSPLVRKITRRGTCTRLEVTDDVENILHRAEYLPSSEIGFGEYHLLKRNCEDFALYCRLGIVGVVGISAQAAQLREKILGDKFAMYIQVENLAGLIYSTIQTSHQLNIRHVNWKQLVFARG